MEKPHPLMETPVIAFVLAIVVGVMDGYTYVTAKTFSTVMAGNIILLGETFVTRDLATFSVIAVTLLGFGLGATSITVIKHFSLAKHQSWTFEILLMEAMILFLLGIKGINQAIGLKYVCMIIAFLAGVQGNAFNKIDGKTYGRVAVTSMVQQAFSYIGQVLVGTKNALKNLLLYVMVLISYAIGGLVGFFSSPYLAERSLWLIAVMLLMVGLWVKFVKKEDSKEMIKPNKLREV